MAATSSEDLELRAEINVTPLVDVVLVLLVIFMVVAPLLQHELPVDLPVARSARNAEPADRLVLAVEPDGALSLSGVPVTRQELSARLEQLVAGGGGRTIFLAAAASLRYGAVVEVMDLCRAAGVTSIGVLTRRTGDASPGAGG
jgi:biopolymer transport protein ExbD